MKRKDIKYIRKTRIQDLTETPFMASSEYFSAIVVFYNKQTLFDSIQL